MIGGIKSGASGFWAIGSGTYWLWNHLRCSFVILHPSPKSCTDGCELVRSVEGYIKGCAFGLFSQRKTRFKQRAADIFPPALSPQLQYVRDRAPTLRHCRTPIDKLPAVSSGLNGCRCQTMFNRIIFAYNPLPDLGKTHEMYLFHKW